MRDRQAARGADRRKVWARKPVEMIMIPIRSCHFGTVEDRNRDESLLYFL